MSNSRRFYICAHGLPFGKAAEGPRQSHHWDDFCDALLQGDVDIVHFNEAHLPDFTRERIVDALKLSSSLKELLIKGSALHRELHDDINMLVGHVALRRLCLSDFQISGHGSNGKIVAALAEVLTKNIALSSLNLQYMSFEQEDLTLLFAALANSEYLVELELNTVKFSVSQLEALQHAIHQNKSLRRVIYLNKDSEKAQAAINTQLLIAMGDKLDVPYSLIQTRSYDALLCKKIEYVHGMLLQLTEGYLQESTSPRKRNIVEMLKLKLTSATDSSKYECIIAFKKAMLVEDQSMSQHRTPKWQRYLCNAFSLFTIIPAVVRGVRSFVRYGTMQFWLSDSQKLVQKASANVHHLERDVLIKSH